MTQSSLTSDSGPISGADAASHYEQVANLQFQIAELNVQIDVLEIDLGTNKIIFESMITQSSKLAPEKQIEHLGRVITLMQKIVTNHEEKNSRIRSSSTPLRPPASDGASDAATDAPIKPADDEAADPSKPAYLAPGPRKRGREAEREPADQQLAKLP